MQSPVSFNGWVHKLQKSKLAVLSDPLTHARHRLDYFCTAERGTNPELLRERSGLSKRGLRACELILLLALTLFLVLISVWTIADTAIQKILYFIGFSIPGLHERVCMWGMYSPGGKE